MVTRMVKRVGGGRWVHGLWHGELVVETVASDLVWPERGLKQGVLTQLRSALGLDGD